MVSNSGGSDSNSVEMKALNQKPEEKPEEEQEKKRAEDQVPDINPASPPGVEVKDQEMSDAAPPPREPGSIFTHYLSPNELKNLNDVTQQAGLMGDFGLSLQPISQGDMAKHTGKRKRFSYEGSQGREGEWSKFKRSQLGKMAGLLPRAISRGLGAVGRVGSEFGQALGLSDQDPRDRSMNRAMVTGAFASQRFRPNVFGMSAYQRALLVNTENSGEGTKENLKTLSDDIDSKHRSGDWRKKNDNGKLDELQRLDIEAFDKFIIESEKLNENIKDSLRKFTLALDNAYKKIEKSVDAEYPVGARHVFPGEQNERETKKHDNETMKKSSIQRLHQQLAWLRSIEEWVMEEAKNLKEGEGEEDSGKRGWYAHIAQTANEARIGCDPEQLSATLKTLYAQITPERTEQGFKVEFNASQKTVSIVAPSRFTSFNAEHFVEEIVQRAMDLIRMYPSDKPLPHVKLDLTDIPFEQSAEIMGRVQARLGMENIQLSQNSIQQQRSKYQTRREPDTFDNLMNKYAKMTQDECQKDFSEYEFRNFTLQYRQNLSLQHLLNSAKLNDHKLKSEIATEYKNAENNLLDYLSSKIPEGNGSSCPLVDALIDEESISEENKQNTEGKLIKHLTTIGKDALRVLYEMKELELPKDKKKTDFKQFENEMSRMTRLNYAAIARNHLVQLEAIHERIKSDDPQNNNDDQKNFKEVFDEYQAALELTKNRDAPSRSAMQLG